MKKIIFRTLIIGAMTAPPALAADLIQSSSGSSPGREMKMKKGVPTYSISSKQRVFLDSVLAKNRLFLLIQNP